MIARLYAARSEPYQQTIDSKLISRSWLKELANLRTCRIAGDRNTELLSARVSFWRRKVDSESSQSRRKLVWKSVQHMFDEFVLPRLSERQPVVGGAAEKVGEAARLPAERNN